jgi:hypothetical protein
VERNVDKVLPGWIKLTERTGFPGIQRDKEIGKIEEVLEEELYVGEEENEGSSSVGRGFADGFESLAGRGLDVGEL